ncbi:hypothetical protein CTI12_AA497850 [Artemisia annua]|uniref:Protein kinase domain-containing protein n=1 Tax=Artemisia annua TaxID=35608 RepID=A0A2U1LFF7_ARTAN|nr:hypothetical protein CTI12_AA497850 [Artemisia annua]
MGGQAFLRLGCLAVMCTPSKFAFSASPLIYQTDPSTREVTWKETVEATFPYNHWTHHENKAGFVFGPNATTFVVPAEIFPARLQSTFNAISAASDLSNVYLDENMSCFPCFLSKEKRRSWRYASRRERSPIVHDSPRLPQNQQRVPAEVKVQKTTSPKRTNKEGANNQAPNKTSADNNIAAQTFTFRELAAVTRNFRQDSLIGEGGFGRVYKGKLGKTGQFVAVKQLDRNGLQGNREFLVEVLMLSLLHHPNLVSLIGYCADGDQRLLVYEYMSAGSLEDHIFDLPPDKAPLAWLTRMKIALDAAKGLEYLHEKASPPVIYLLLKIGWQLGGLETVDQAEPIFKNPKRFPELVDPLLKEDYPEKGLNQAIAVAAMCLNDDASVRPFISDVVTALTFLGDGNDMIELIDSPSESSLSRCSSDMNQEKKASTSERKRQVAEAMEWGTSSRTGVTN